MAQIAIADFTNPLGLEKVGDTAFRASANSGAVELGVAGQGSRGNLMSGAVEMSNVDLAAEFTNLILAQRGFQDSSRVITTSDSVLEELDRKSGVSGKSVSVRVDLGGRRIIKKKKQGE